MAEPQGLDRVRLTAAVLLLLGAGGIVAGTVLLCWPAGIVVGGALLLLAGIDLRP